MSYRTIFCAVALAALLSVSGSAKQLFVGDESVPADAVVLFDGKDLSGWLDTRNGEAASWKVENGYMEVGPGCVYTKEEFGDFQLHVEFWLPLMPEAEGQGRANSGVYMHGIYELQVLDSYGVKELETGDCGGIYGVSVPMVNASRPPETWQSYDIFFRAPRLSESGEVVSAAKATVLLNGVLIQENVEIRHPTGGGMGGEVREKGPIMLQDHSNPVRYRNIWARNL